MSDEFKTKKEVALSRLKYAIQSGRLKPGDRLRQNDLAKELGLSSTPVREALQELQSLGLLVHEPHRGMRVAALEVERITRVYAARQIIEGETARLAFPNINADLIQQLDAFIQSMEACQLASDYEGLSKADMSFHLTMLEASDNEFLVKAATDLWNSFPKYLIWGLEGRLEDSMREHRAMVSALKAGNGKQFVHEIAHHIQHSGNVLIRYVAEQSKITESENK